MQPSAWELDTRPTNECFVCGAEPERAVTIPEVPGSHVHFGNPAICSDCAAAAAAGDASTIERRSWPEHDDDPDRIIEVVRAALAIWQHELPPLPVVPEKYRHRVLESLSDQDLAVWAELKPRVFRDDDSDVIHGRIEGVRDGATSVSVVHRDGRRARVTGADGRPFVVTDGVTMWRRHDLDEPMSASPYSGAAWGPDGSALAYHRTVTDTELFSFGQPIGPLDAVRYLGRDAWRFRFAAPAHKPYDMLVVIDAETGLVLEQQFGEHSLARWTEFAVGGEPDPALFAWDGPTIDPDAVRADQDEVFEAHARTADVWFAENVAATPLLIDGGTVTVMLHVWAADGSFEAGLGGAVEAMVARRPRSGHWWRLGWSEVGHRWSDERWDWALSIWPDDPFDVVDDATVAALKDALTQTPGSAAQ